MKGDAKVIEYLNRGLRHEMTAINQYWLHYRLLGNWGYKALRQILAQGIDRGDAARRQDHRPDHLSRRLSQHAGVDPLHIGQNVKEVLDCDLQAENSARALYQEAATHCHPVKDYVTRDLFEELMHAEEEHIDFLETQIDLVSKLGVELYSQHHIGKLEDGDD